MCLSLNKYEWMIFLDKTYYWKYQRLSFIDEHEYSRQTHYWKNGEHCASNAYCYLNRYNI